MKRNTSLVLSGAGAKGSYHAGVLREVAGFDVRVVRIAGTSAGALNGAVYAAGVACGRPRLAAEVLREMWLGGGAWHKTLSFSLGALLRQEGLSTTVKLQALLEEALEKVWTSPLPVETDPDLDVKFRCVCTDLGGVRMREEGDSLVTHEREFSFSGAVFGHASGRRCVARVATASAAFPGIFAPVIVDGRVLVDGGVCDNAPLSYAIDDEAVEGVIVVRSGADKRTPKRRLTRGPAIFSEVFDLLVNERISRDLEALNEMNRRVAAFGKGLDEIHLADRGGVCEAFPYRHIGVIDVKPSAELPGGTFSGLWSRKLREEYYDVGRKTAAVAIQKQMWIEGE